MLYCFLDTNILLQFQPFYQINWLDVLKVKQVCLVIFPAVIRELEQKKSGDNARLQKRAKSIIQKLDDYSVHEDNLLRQDVYLRILVIHPERETLRAIDCNPDIPDDQIAGTAFLFKQETGYDVMMVSGDTGVRFKAKFLKLPVVTLPDNLKLPAEQDPLQKENQELKRELLRLQNAQPKLLVSLFNDTEAEKSNKAVFDISPNARTLSSEDIENQLRLEAAELQYEVTDGYMVQMLIPSPFEYKNNVDAYLKSYERYLNNLWLWQQRNHHIRKLHFVISNSGEKPAEDIDLFVSFPNDVKLLESRPDKPNKPKRPQKPQQNFMPEIFTYNFDSPRYQIQNSVSEDEETTVDIDISKNKVTVHQKSLKHGHRVNIPVLLEFSEIWKTNPQIIPIDYFITVANLPKEIEGTLLIEVMRLGN